MADPGFPVGGDNIVGGRQLSMQLAFLKYVCQNERMHDGCAPLDPPLTAITISSWHNMCPLKLFSNLYCIVNCLTFTAVNARYKKLYSNFLKNQQFCVNFLDPLDLKSYAVRTYFDHIKSLNATSFEAIQLKSVIVPSF